MNRFLCNVLVILKNATLIIPLIEGVVQSIRKVIEYNKKEQIVDAIAEEKEED